MQKDKVKILIIDDHPALAYGTQLIVEQLPFVEVMGVAQKGSEGVLLAERETPDLVLLDLSLPDQHGLEVAKQIRILHANAHIVVYTGEENIELYLNSLLSVGISGLIHKRVSPTQLLRTVELILEGQVVLPRSVFKHLNCKFVESNELNGLKSIDLDILKLLTKGNTNFEIAQTLHVSIKTVENHLTHIYRQLGVGSRTEAIRKYQLIMDIGAR